MIGGSDLDHRIGRGNTNETLEDTRVVTRSFALVHTSTRRDLRRHMNSTSNRFRYAQLEQEIIAEPKTAEQFQVVGAQQQKYDPLPFTLHAHVSAARR